MSSSNQSLSSGAQTALSKLAVDPRRGRRLHIALPVKVFSDAGSLDFQICCTYEISLIGVRLVMPSGIKEIGQVVMLQRHNRKAKYKVAWIGKAGTPEAGQVGVDVMEPHNVIWENELKAKLLRPE
jgi:hypothetical protein